MQFYRHKLKTKHLEASALCFIPKNATSKVGAVFTHGHTSHKGAILAWAEKLYHAGIASAIFDLPGHYLGEGSEVLSLDEFSLEAPLLFKEAIEKISTHATIESWVVGGHSLGALLALKFLAQEKSPQPQLFAILVGFASASKNGQHLYQDPLFEKMLEFRSQLVSPALHHKHFFPWIRIEKEQLELHGNSLLLLSGKDDLVARASEVEDLAKQLSLMGNEVDLKLVDKLPHHEPEKAATLIRDYLKIKFDL